MKHVVAMILLAAATATPAQAVTYGFCWRGADGYRIEGYISYAASDARGILTEEDVQGFGITGWRHDTYIGRWSLEELTPETSWTLRFDAERLAFPMGGHRGDGTYQEWNADGFAEDCGDPGFGFNGGNRAQDLCVDGVFIDASGIDAATPLWVSHDAADPCGPLPVSGLPRRRSVG